MAGAFPSCHHARIRVHPRLVDQLMTELTNRNQQPVTGTLTPGQNCAVTTNCSAGQCYQSVFQISAYKIHKHGAVQSKSGCEAQSLAQSSNVDEKSVLRRC